MALFSGIESHMESVLRMVIEMLLGCPNDMFRLSYKWRNIDETWRHKQSFCSIIEVTQYQHNNSVNVYGGCVMQILKWFAKFGSVLYVCRNFNWSNHRNIVGAASCEASISNLISSTDEDLCSFLNKTQNDSEVTIQPVSLLSLYKICRHWHTLFCSALGTIVSISDQSVDVQPTLPIQSERAQQLNQRIFQIVAVTDLCTTQLPAVHHYSSSPLPPHMHNDDTCTPHEVQLYPLHKTMRNDSRVQLRLDTYTPCYFGMFAKHLAIASLRQLLHNMIDKLWDVSGTISTVRQSSTGDNRADPHNLKDYPDFLLPLYHQVQLAIEDVSILRRFRHHKHFASATKGSDTCGSCNKSRFVDIVRSALLDFERSLLQPHHQHEDDALSVSTSGGGGGGGSYRYQQVPHRKPPRVSPLMHYLRTGTHIKVTCIMSDQARRIADSLAAFSRVSTSETSEENTESTVMVAIGDNSTTGTTGTMCEVESAAVAFGAFVSLRTKRDLAVIQRVHTLLNASSASAAAFVHTQFRLHAQLQYLLDVYFLGNSAIVYASFRDAVDSIVTLSADLSTGLHMRGGGDGGFTAVQQLCISAASAMMDLKPEVEGIELVSVTSPTNAAVSRSVSSAAPISSCFSRQKSMDEDALFSLAAVVSVQLHLSYPLTDLLSPALLRQMNAVSNFLLQLTCAKWLSECWWKLAVSSGRLARTAALSDTARRQSAREEEEDGEESAVIGAHKRVCAAGLSLLLRTVNVLLTYFAGECQQQFSAVVTMCADDHSGYFLRDLRHRLQVVVQSCEDLLRPVRPMVTELLHIVARASAQLRTALQLEALFVIAKPTPTTAARSIRGGRVRQVDTSLQPTVVRTDPTPAFQKAAEAFQAMSMFIDRLKAHISGEAGEGGLFEALERLLS